MNDSFVREWCRKFKDGAGCSQKASVVLLHDKGRPHTAARTNALIKLFNWEIFDQPPYIPDLAPIYYHLFTKMKV
jgi:transposase